MKIKYFAWPQIIGIILVQIFGDTCRFFWEKNSQIVGILSDVSWLPADLIFTIIMVVLAVKIYEQSNPEQGLISTLVKSTSLSAFASGILLGLVIQLVITLSLLFSVHYFLDVKTSLNEQAKAMSMFPVILDASYIAVYEEILYRGLILAGLCKITRPAFAIAIQAGIFTVLHFHQVQLNVFYILAIFIIGWILGYVTYTRHSLWPAIGGHLAWNFWGLTVLGTPLSGKLLPPLIKLSAENGTTYANVLAYALTIEIICLLLLAMLLVCWEKRNAYSKCKRS